MSIEDHMELAESVTSAAVDGDSVSPETLKNFHRALAVWLDDLAQPYKNVEFYRGLHGL